MALPKGNILLSYREMVHLRALLETHADKEREEAERDTEHRPLILLGAKTSARLRRIFSVAMSSLVKESRPPRGRRR